MISLTLKKEIVIQALVEARASRDTFFSLFLFFLFADFYELWRSGMSTCLFTPRVSDGFAAHPSRPKVLLALFCFFFCHRTFLEFALSERNLSSQYTDVSNCLQALISVPNLPNLALQLMLYIERFFGLFVPIWFIILKIRY